VENAGDSIRWYIPTRELRRIQALLVENSPRKLSRKRPKPRLKLHATFTSHMVLQRDKPIVVWGWADAGDKVSVTRRPRQPLRAMQGVGK
jgi:hypothetical protein